MSSQFASRRWPKCHEHLVEECKELHISVVVPRLPQQSYEQRTSWMMPGFPTITCVPRRAGFHNAWCFVCFQCERRVESLYIPLGVEGGDWRCRKCWSLVYASQRHGQRHPLRKYARHWTHRKRRSGQREIDKQERRRAQQQAVGRSTLAKIAANSSTPSDARIMEMREQAMQIVRAMRTTTAFAVAALPHAPRRKAPRGS